MHVLGASVANIEKALGVSMTLPKENASLLRIPLILMPVNLAGTQMALTGSRQLAVTME